MPGSNASDSGATDPGSARDSDPTHGLGLVGLVLLSAIGPIATDIYLPSLPGVIGDLRTNAATVQLTISGFMLGLAFGQLLLGPISDALGRRRLIVAGALVCLLSSVACALAPSIGFFVAARVVQGFSGAAGVVLARAVITDVTAGVRTARLIAALMAIVGIAPVVAPLAGAIIATFASWRAAFWVMAAAVTASLALAIARIPETLPLDRRKPGGAGQVMRNLATVVRRRLYLGYLLSFALAFGAFFSYIAASSFVLEVQHHFSPAAYGATFAAGGLLLTASTTLAGKLAGRVRQQSMMTVGMVGLLASGALMLTGALAGMPLWMFLTGVAIVTLSMGQIMSNAASLALHHTRDLSGTGSALIGFAQFIMAAAVAPLVGVAGAGSPLPFGVAFAASAMLAGCAFFVIALPGERRAGAR